MVKHKKGLVSIALIFVGLTGYATLKTDAATTGQGLQNLRYCTINNIYKVSREDCPLRQDRILNGLDQKNARPQNGTGERRGNRNYTGNGKQDGTGPRRVDGSRVPDCPNFEEKQSQNVQNTSTAPVTEPTNYGTQPQEGTGNQYGQQSLTPQQTNDVEQTQNAANYQAQQAAQEAAVQQQWHHQQQQKAAARQQAAQQQQQAAAQQQQAQQQQVAPRVHHNYTTQQTNGHHGNRHH
ncbi:hypothetical protein [Enterococcus sp.]|uniref:hypothetical protein n=1 Tax=Enterococcus sp. TaxID=35783 RepID=UPI002907F4B0|nr:hypothetical protein [Enterococcus sp.]MDU5333286.1 hypothetical protein [Enterococcus sp.]